MIKIDYDEIWYWYQRIEEFKASNLGQKEYCDSYNVDYKKFCNMLYRIEYKRRNYPENYAKLLPLAQRYKESGKSAAVFAKENNVHIRTLSEMGTHLSYQEIIEELKAQNYQSNSKYQPKSIPRSEPKAMGFLQVPQRLPAPLAPPAELVESQNDIEITIAKGVKVSIAPNIDPMKIIKIIELLKDL